jgi:hypothetical protein
LPACAHLRQTPLGISTFFFWRSGGKFLFLRNQATTRYLQSRFVHPPG